ncbi:unnamed protein product [Taenia asiatica]|uniref:Uncharacterized protein n=1 Tax=Taenia asiatica TaxID=60517 RepID=A0A0R3VZT9_TAEAS|nr:unnamed protein product [Taenia asiatica]
MDKASHFGSEACGFESRQGGELSPFLCSSANSRNLSLQPDARRSNRLSYPATDGAYLNQPNYPPPSHPPSFLFSSITVSATTLFPHRPLYNHPLTRFLRHPPPLPTLNVVAYIFLLPLDAKPHHATALHDTTASCVTVVVWPSEWRATLVEGEEAW